LKNQERAQNFRFVYSPFSKVKIIFGRRCALRSFQYRRPLLSHHKQEVVAHRTARVRCHRPESKRMWPHERGVELGWMDLGIWGQCQLRFVTGRCGCVRKEGSGQSNHKRQYVGSLFCNVSSSPKDTINSYFNFEFRIFNGNPPSNSFLKPIHQDRNILNYLSPFQI